MDDYFFDKSITFKQCTIWFKQLLFVTSILGVQVIKESKKVIEK